MKIAVKNLILLGLIAVCYSCSTPDKPKIREISYDFLNKESCATKPGDNNSISVFVFFSPDCPLCINYSKNISQLSSQFSDKNVHFYAVFPGDYYSVDEINRFQNENAFHECALLDKNYQITRMLKATVTPEAIVINRDGKIAYTGAIDNWAYRQGGKRREATAFYLQSALTNILGGKPANPRETEPVGCFIE